MSDLPEKLGKKEKARLEQANAKAFEGIVEHFGKKSDAYLSSYMPEKIVLLTKILADLGDLKTALPTVVDGVKLPPLAPSLTHTNGSSSSSSSSSSAAAASPSSASSASSSSTKENSAAGQKRAAAAEDDKELPKSKKRKLDVASNGASAEPAAVAMTDDDDSAAAASSTTTTTTTTGFANCVPQPAGASYPCEVDSYVRKGPRTDEEVARLRQHVPCNEALLPVLGRVKTEALEFVEMVGLLKIWIQLNIPRIEDGNNFGVGVQEEIVGELASTEDASFSIIEHTTKYFVARGKLVSKVLKWPEMLDYRNSVKELDEKEFIQLRLDCIDLRNHYLTLYDMMQKNIEKLKKPRSSLAYQSMF